jgi:PAS domain S-box-containing protein
VFLINTDGAIIFSPNDREVRLDSVEEKCILEAVSNGNIVSSDFFYQNENGVETLYQSYFVPVKEDEKKILAILVARINPDDFLIPVNEIPIPYQTYESYIFRVESDSIIILNILDNFENTALNNKLPVNQPNLIEAKALSGQTGILSGLDFRNNEVIGWVSKIKGTPWYFVSKIDKSEIFEEVTFITGAISLFSIMAILFTAITFVFFYTKRQKNIFKELLLKENELLNTHQKFKDIMNCMSEGVIVTEMTGTIQFMNPRAELQTGWELQEAFGKDLHEIYKIKNEETGEKIHFSFEKNDIIKGATKRTNKIILITRYNEDIPIFQSSAPVYFNDGSINGIVILFEEERERRQQQKLLTEREQFFRSILASLSAHIAVVDHTGAIVAVNESWQQFALINGATPHGRTSVGSNYFDICKKAIEEGDTLAAEALNGIISVAEGKKDFFIMEYPCHSPEKQRWFTLRASPIVGDKNSVVLAHEDITDKMLAQIELMKSEETFREFFENDITGDYSATIDGQLIMCNQALAGLFGYNSPDELVGRNIIEFYKEPKKREGFLKLLKESGFLKDFDVTLKHKNGSDLIIKKNSVGVFDKSGNIVKYFSYLLNITQQRKAEEKLLIREQLLSSVMDTQDVLIARYLPDTTLTFVNRAYCDLFGMTEKELVGRKYLEFVPETEVEQEQSVIKSLDANNPRRTSVSRAVNADGYDVSIEWIDTAIFNEQNEVIEFQSTGIDISEKLRKEKLIRESENKYRSLFEKSFDSILVCEAGLILDCNLAAIKLLGAKGQNDIIGKYLLDFISPESGKIINEIIFLDKNQGEHFRYIECKLININNKIIETEISVIPFSINNKDSTMIVINDISDREMAKKNLAALKVSEQINQERSKFLANISHEIRTPMNAILGFSDLIKKTAEDEKLIKRIDIIHTSGKNLLRLVNDILDLSKIDAGKMEIKPAPFNFRKTIHDIEAIYKQNAQNKGILFQAVINDNVPPILIMDETRVRQILYNLIGNAIKFTDKGMVKLNVNSNKTIRNRIDLIIEVEDTGIGIPEDEQEKIFESFTQVKSLSSQKGGTGLGLAITKRLIELMDGNISVKSIPGQGSLFKIVIPDIVVRKNNINEQTEDLETQTQVMFENPTILIADDNPTNIFLLEEILVPLNLKIISAKNGLEVIEHVKEYQPDFVLMDLRMPGINGKDAAQILKTDNNTKHIPIMAMTATSASQFINKFENINFVDYILKPIDTDQLISKLKKYLKHSVKVLPRVEENKIQFKDQYLSEEQKAACLKLSLFLDKQLMPECLNIIREQQIDLIEEFGIKLSNLGMSEGCSILSEYGNQIQLFAENIEIEKLMDLLRNFPEIISQIKTLAESNK